MCPSGVQGGSVPSPSVEETPSLDLEPAGGFEQLLGAAVHYRTPGKMGRLDDRPPRTDCMARMPENRHEDHAHCARHRAGARRLLPQIQSAARRRRLYSVREEFGIRRRDLRVFLTLKDGTAASVNTRDDVLRTLPGATPIPGHQARAWTFRKVAEEGTSVTYALLSLDPDDPEDYLMAGWWAQFPGQRPPEPSFERSEQYAIVDLICNHLKILTYLRSSGDGMKALHKLIKSSKFSLTCKEH